MNIGLGIFLGCVFLGLIYLYIHTRTQWKWGRIGKVIAITGIGLFALGGIALAAIYGYAQWETRPTVVTGMKGVYVGDKLSDVEFRIGNFERKFKDPLVKRLYEDEEEYEQAQSRLYITTRQGYVNAVFYECDKASDYMSLNRIQCGNSGESIKERFGADVRVLCFLDKDNKNGKSVRVFDVPRYGVRYTLWMNTVVQFAAFPPSDLQKLVGLNWENCP